METVSEERVPVGIGVVVTRAEGPEQQVLMIRRFGKHGSGTWAVPGGWVDPGEDPAETCVRELQEEVGIEAKAEDMTLLGYTRDVYEEGLEDICLWFRAERYTGVPEPKEYKIQEVRWCRWSQLPEPLFASCRNALDKGLIPIS